MVSLIKCLVDEKSVQQLQVIRILVRHNTICNFNINVSISKATQDIWQKWFCDRKLVFVQVFAVWILPILMCLPKSFELDESGNRIDYAPGKGNETGYVCYPKIENGTQVYFTKLQYKLSLSNDIAVLLFIAISGCIVLWSLKREADVFRERHKHNELAVLQYNIFMKQKVRSISKSIEIICVAYFVSRLPWMIFAKDFKSAETFSPGMRVSLILYLMKFSLPYLLFCFTNKYYRRAYLDILKLPFPCFFKDQEDENNADK